MPAEQYETNSATTVATKIRATFKKIPLGLMVSIGGSVPSKEVGIRLGDVVVSQPHQSFNGVVQYDMGKTISERRVQTSVGFSAADTDICSSKDAIALVDG